jgi:hypothetical protein
VGITIIKRSVSTTVLSAAHAIKDVLSAAAKKFKILDIRVCHVINKKGSTTHVHQYESGI